MPDYIICPACEHPSVNYVPCVVCKENIAECECELGKKLAPGKDGRRRWRCVTCEEDAVTERVMEHNADTRGDR